ncbi:hypothetical protein WCE14_09300 [Acinetobacter schindleri]|uniref:Uncharacterized protein n=1 Tax=Acinetobacter schindleri NIPH 900 TaxID=1217675 RepID=N8Y5T7_9GAMM|nr:hypothetical protein [Acinetobacter schindleri]ENV14685.1 hypothetical protein F965_00031 [Acinetobacter schindleri NIPH 900]
MTGIATEKPEAPTSRFNKAKEFGQAKNENEVTEAAPAEKRPRLRRKKNTEPTFRENFDLEVSLGKEMRTFLLESRRFRNKREFLTQCLKDGLKKYAGQ